MVTDWMPPEPRPKKKMLGKQKCNRKTVLGSQPVSSSELPYVIHCPRSLRGLHATGLSKAVQEAALVSCTPIFWSEDLCRVSGQKQDVRLILRACDWFSSRYASRQSHTRNLGTFHRFGNREMQFVCKMKCSYKTGDYGSVYYRATPATIDGLLWYF